MRSRTLSLLALTLTLVSCGGDTPPPTEPETDEAWSSSSSQEAIAETHNVSFIGTIRPAGISIYMEGTHRLELGDGRFVLLSSETVDLNGYVGEEAEVTGSIRPTVEEGGTIMRVERIRLMESASVSSTPSSSAAAAASSSSSSLPSSSAPAASSVPATPPPASSAAASSVTDTPSVDLSAQIAAMAKQKLDTANWTQAYCAPPTIGFCVPIHRNWYFKSFGTASEALWHVEVGSQSIESVGEGAIAVNLVGGSLSTKGVADGTVRVDGSSVRGYREWTKDRHIEIVAPAALQAAVEYMTQHLSAMEAEPGA
ncbi:MAG TPA: hypothetical protein DEB30_04740 [Candidatus Peribacter riflensis]|uniref:Lipoprotein n=1 Tax=Candidatus Peribacter riflensis TaxID=1735162 RepID=A0A0S1SNQ2_9BACT|nr:MAG: hypothetical protein PeribacterA2_0391 [Candidatus Peribacter riflensis]OGJ78779.1 MAG: hypothetical protein A2398_00565 [Candidatus Peribacteria bacterium RIFOXYB1_FULL_57_12]OGJ83250.1 MAG: hypothetical protein A2412_04380 [Candidatus Peribacteria bacterium RIFOXYC1_FULL_58_8]ALM10881.1 MAG: hypothetical protein PeribacterB2_0391 [Candidatus Peribacter riflensis]ALM11983.1 MAG: hypothetical protein PeribacterC2_0390 [Candidatus Peribacter riflensis]